MGSIVSHCLQPGTPPYRIRIDFGGRGKEIFSLKNATLDGAVSRTICGELRLSQIPAFFRAVFFHPAWTNRWATVVALVSSDGNISVVFLISRKHLNHCIGRFWCEMVKQREISEPQQDRNLPIVREKWRFVQICMTSRKSIEYAVCTKICKCIENTALLITILVPPTLCAH